MIKFFIYFFQFWVVLVCYESFLFSLLSESESEVA